MGLFCVLLRYEQRSAAIDKEGQLSRVSAKKRQPKHDVHCCCGVSSPSHRYYCSYLVSVKNIKITENSVVELSKIIEADCWFVHCAFQRLVY